MKLPAIAFTQETLSRFDEVMSKEWLITNGLGGYASTTVLGINTRKYHGLLVAALHPPGDRTVCLSKLDEDVIVGNDVYRLGANEFHDAIYPQGYKLIKAVFNRALSQLTPTISAASKLKNGFYAKKQERCLSNLQSFNKNSFEVKIRIYPLLTCRYFHTVLDRLKNPLDFTQKSSNKEVETAFQHPEATIVCRSTDGDSKRK